MESDKKTKFEQLKELKEPEILESWRKEQDELKSKLVLTDFYKFNLSDDPKDKDGIELKYVAGMDISASKHIPNIAVSALVVCDKDLKVVYEDYKLVKMDEPYVPGFLAFREVKHLVDLINDLKVNAPQFTPQVILVDGNGILHVKGFGLKELSKQNLIKGGDSFPLIGDSGTQWGYAFKSNDEVTNPMIISTGYKLSNDTALKIVKKSIVHRVPQPIRISDKISRRLIEKYEEFIIKNPGKEWDLKTYLKENYDNLYSNLGE